MLWAPRATLLSGLKHARCRAPAVFLGYTILHSLTREHHMLALIPQRGEIADSRVIVVSLTQPTLFERRSAVAPCNEHGTLDVILCNQIIILQSIVWSSCPGGWVPAAPTAVPTAAELQPSTF